MGRKIPKIMYHSPFRIVQIETITSSPVKAIAVTYEGTTPLLRKKFAFAL